MSKRRNAVLTMMPSTGSCRSASHPLRISTLSERGCLCGRKYLLLVAALMLVQSSLAQILGGDPPSIRWKQIDTDTVRVIFPAGLEEQAQQVANTTLYLNAHARRSAGDRELKLNIVLQNPGTFSNGYVSLSPFRSEFELTPPAASFELGSMNWLRQLSLHEYRHALQNMNFRTGIGKTFYTLFGQNGQAIATSVLIPGWFWEGDAVFMETALSLQGRGRLPSFMKEFRGMYLEDKEYPYAKVLNGSYKDRLPGVYPLGYLMVSYGREKYGLHFWEKIANEALLSAPFIRRESKATGRKPFHWLQYDLYPWAAALKYNTGYKIPGFYGQAFRYYASAWESQKEQIAQTPLKAWPAETGRKVTDFTYPYFLPGDRILAIRSSFDRSPELVTIDTTGEVKTLVKLGQMQDAYFSFGGGQAVWAELRYDPRWGWRNYSVIRRYDLREGRTYTLTHHSRYFSPAVSGDGKYIIAHEVTPAQQYRLVLLDAKSGALVKKLPNTDRLFYTYPKFSADGSTIYAAVRNDSGEMALAAQPLNGGRVAYLTPFTHHVLGAPVPAGEYVLFPAAYTDAVNLYALHLPDGKISQVASRLQEDQSAAADSAGRQIVLSEFSLEGYRLKKLPWDTAGWKALDPAALLRIHDPYVPGALAQEGGSVAGKIPARNLPVRPYKPSRHLLSLHSWSFLPEFPDVGYYLQSQDVLNTLQMNLGGGYNYNEKNPFLRFRALYGGWFPVLNLGVTEQFRRHGYTPARRKVYWNETLTTGGVTIPLELSANRYLRSLSAGSNITVNSLHFLPGGLKRDDYAVSYIDPFLQFVNVVTSAKQQIYPRFGQTLTLQYRHTLGAVFAEQVSARANLFFPGIGRTHSLYMDLGVAKRDRRQQYTFPDDFAYARGYNTLPYYKIWKAGINYQLPLCYPDAGLTWAYLLRIRAQAFFDYSRAHLQPGFPEPLRTFRSVGGALYFDTKLVGVALPVGVRYSCLLDPDMEEPARKGRLELVISLPAF